MAKDLDNAFEEAYLKASSTNKKLPQDVMLQLYATYKKATKGNNYVESSSNGIQLRNAFKLNAWIQLSHLTEGDAKIEYIKLVNKHL